VNFLHGDTSYEFQIQSIFKKAAAASTIAPIRLESPLRRASPLRSAALEAKKAHAPFWSVVSFRSKNQLIPYLFFLTRTPNPNNPIDKSSLWGGSNIQKRQWSVKGFFAQHHGFVWRPFPRGLGGFSG
jgi:hypothetical protein